MNVTHIHRRPSLCGALLLCCVVLLIGCKREYEAQWVFASSYWPIETNEVGQVVQPTAEEFRRRTHKNCSNLYRMTDSFILAGDVSLVERAKELFSEARINDPAVVYDKSQECIDFKRDWNACADETTVAEVNRILLTSLTSFKAVVSTNEVDAGTSGVMIQDRRDGLVYPRFAWKHGCKVPKEDLLTLARYIGTLQDGVYVRNPHAAEVQAGEVNGDG